MDRTWSGNRRREIISWSTSFPFQDRGHWCKNKIKAFSSVTWFLMLPRFGFLQTNINQELSFSRPFILLYFYHQSYNYSRRKKKEKWDELFYCVSFTMCHIHHQVISTTASPYNSATTWKGVSVGSRQFFNSHLFRIFGSATMFMILDLA